MVNEWNNKSVEITEVRVWGYTDVVDAEDGRVGRVDEGGVFSLWFGG